MGSTIDMYIFKNPKFKDEIKLIIEKIYKKYIYLNRLEILQFDFKCDDSKVGYVWLYTYLSPTEFTKSINPIEIEELFFTIYKEFFPNEVAYVNSEKELEGGYQNIFYYENKHHYFDSWDNIAYDIRKMFRNYNELRKLEPNDYDVSKIDGKIQTGNKKLSDEELEKIGFKKRNSESHKKLSGEELEKIGFKKRNS